MSFFMENRGNLTVMNHPLSDDEIWDHTLNALWLGDSYRLNIDVLDHSPEDSGEYPELGLGYSTYPSFFSHE